MYEAFYGFKEKPFSMLPDPGFLYLSKKHQAALTLLEYGLLNNVGFCVISGEAGAGKTTILRALLERVDDSVTVGLITNTHQSFGGLLDWVLSAFDLHRPNLTHVEMHQVFMEFLIDEYAKNRTVLLIVDEAQNMKADALEELRMLSNVNSEKDQLMQVVLAGQPALKETLRSPELMQFAQRIAVDYHLDPLSVEETCGYIQHRLVVAGAQQDVFTPAACERIHAYSGGTPRLINLLCETVMVYGFADQQQLIDVDLVDEMVLERMKDSVVPIVNRDIAEQGPKEPSEEVVKDFPWIRPQGGTRGLKPEDKIDDALATASVTASSRNFADTVEETPLEGDDVELETSDNSGTEQTVQSDSGSARDEDTEPGLNEKATDEISEEDTPVDAETEVPLRQKPSPVIPVQSEGESEKRKSYIRYAVIAGIIAIIFSVLAVMINVDDKDEESQALQQEKMQQMQKQRAEEEARLQQLRNEAEALKKERDEAIARAEEEKRAKLEAKRAAEAEAAAAVKLAQEKALKAEKKRLAEAEKREAQARASAERARKEAAALEEKQRLDRQRLEEERIARQREALRLEREQQEKELLQQRLIEMEEAKVRAERLAAEAAAAKKLDAEKSIPKNKSAACTGPTARFKAGCR